MKRVGIIDYKICNVNSVYSAFEHLGENVSIVTNPEEIKLYTHLVLPGVGAFAEGIGNLESMGLIQPIRDFAGTGRPLLGICLGMQLLLSMGNEFERVPGLSLIDGDVCELKEKEQGAGVYPHTGWNRVRLGERCSLAKYSGDSDFYYFNHSYVCCPKDDSVQAGYVTLIEEHVAIIEQDNIIGLQFHPEKSHTAGLKLLSGFMAQE